MRTVGRVEFCVRNIVRTSIHSMTGLQDYHFSIKMPTQTQLLLISRPTEELDIEQALLVACGLCGPRNVNRYEPFLITHIGGMPLRAKQNRPSVAAANEFLALNTGVYVANGRVILHHHNTLTLVFFSNLLTISGPHPDSEITAASILNFFISIPEYMHLIILFEIYLFIRETKQTLTDIF